MTHIPRISPRGPQRTAPPSFASSNRASARWYARPLRLHQRGFRRVRKSKIVGSQLPGCAGECPWGPFWLSVRSLSSPPTMQRTSGLCARRFLAGLRCVRRVLPYADRAISSVISRISTLAFNGGGMPLATSVAGASPFYSPAVSVLHIDPSSSSMSAANLRHAAIVARSGVHLFLCELFDGKLKCRQPGKLDGKQREGDAKLMEPCPPVTNAYGQRS